MVDISINDKNELIVSFRGGNFHELVEAAKYANLTFDRTNKVWKGSIPRLHDVVAEFNTVEPVELSALTQKKAADYMNSLREQKVERRVFDWSPLKFSPLVGKGEYKDFQKLDIQTAYNHDRYFFAWGTGCGKSYALAALYANYRQKYGIRKAILFSSSIGILNVKQELEKFIDIDPNTIKVIGSVAKLKGEDRLVVAPEIDILIMTYDALKYVQDAYHDYAKKDNTKKRNGAKSSKFKINQLPLEDWLNGHEGILFMDESHLLGNPKSRRSECVDMVLPYFQKRYLFTATPWDDFSKAYMQLRALDNQLVEGLKYQDWLAEYYDIGTRWSAYAPDLNSLDEKKERSLNENLRRDYMIVRKKEDVLDIPAQYEYPQIMSEMTEKHRFIYEQFSNYVFNEAKKEAENQDSDLPKTMASKFAFAMLAVENPSRLLHSEKFSTFKPELQLAIQKFKFEKDFSKLDAIDNVVEEECGEYGHKILMYYEHPLTMEYLAKHYSKYEPQLIIAGMDAELRMSTINDFKKSKTSKICLASIHIANTSITLTECSAIVYAEKTWHYPTYEQSLGRINRPGQTRESKVYTFQYVNSLDQLQADNLMGKGSVVNDIARQSHLSPDAWKRVFKGMY